MKTTKNHGLETRRTRRNPAKPISLGFDRADMEGHFRYPAGNDLSIEPPGLFFGFLAGFRQGGSGLNTRRRRFAEYFLVKCVFLWVIIGRRGWAVNLTPAAVIIQ